MKYEYGASLTVIAPDGQKVQAQVGKSTAEGPMLHIRSYQVDAPLNLLRGEGWQIPDLEVAAPGAYAAEAARIVDALVDEDGLISGHTLPVLKSPNAKPTTQRPPVGRNPYTHSKDIPHCGTCGSRTHPTEECPHKGESGLFYS